MVNLSFMEFGENKNINQQPIMSCYLTHSFGFMTANNSSNFMRSYEPDIIKDMDVKDVTKSFFDGNYEWKTEYTILYLYDIFSDAVSESFIKDYGGRLHNITSSSMTFLTYFEPETANNWRNVQQRNMIKNGEKWDGMDVMNMVRAMKEYFQLENMPAAVVIKHTPNEEIQFIGLDMSSHKTPGSLWIAFQDIVGVINDNCEEDFDVIKRIFKPKASKKKKEYHEINTNDYIWDAVKRRAKVERGEEPDTGGYTQEDCAQSIGVSVRQLQEKRKNNSLTRDELICLAFLLKIPFVDLQTLLRENHQPTLGYDGKDSIIKARLERYIEDELYDDEILLDVNQELIRKGFFGILNEKAKGYLME